MTPALLLEASPLIQVHALVAMGAVVLGGVQLAAPKGTPSHRLVGAIWVLLMLFVSVSAFFIHQLRIWGPWSPVHLLALLVLIMLPIAVWHAHRHDVRGHRRTMQGLFVVALLAGGVFSLLPDSIMHAVLLGS